MRKNETNERLIFKEVRQNSKIKQTATTDMSVK
jgi:hypothetical protein